MRFTCLRFFILLIFICFAIYITKLIVSLFLPRGKLIGSYPNHPFKYQDLKDIQNCLVEKLDALISSNENQTLNWMKLDKVPSECSSVLFNNIPLLNASTYENKYFLPPLNSGNTEHSGVFTFFKVPRYTKSCSILSFGIGQEIIIEEILKRNFPKCSFLGFDPDEINKDLFENNLDGKFVKAAIGGQQRIEKAHLRE